MAISKKFNPGGIDPTKTPPAAPPPPGAPEGEAGGFIRVDPELIEKYGNQLLGPADKMGEAADEVESQAARQTKYGDAPWGHGEIGDAYKEWYGQQAVPLIQSVRDMQEGIYNVTGKFGVKSKKYQVMEDSNMITPR